MCRELKLDFEHRDTHFAGEEIRSPEYHQINPNQRIPALRDGDFVLWESLAINLYLARKYPSELTLGFLEEEALAWQWSFWVMTEVEKSVLGVLLRRSKFPEGSVEEKYFSERFPKDPAQEQALIDALDRPLRALEAHLQGREYLVAPRFTVADLNVASVLAWAKRAKLDLAAFPSVAAWLERCLSRPASRG
jgi:glutathione S-transferase